MLREDFVKLLVCPVSECRGPLDLRGEQLVCSRCGRRYRIEQAWPVLIPEEAELPEGEAPR